MYICLTIYFWRTWKPCAHYIPPLQKEESECSARLFRQETEIIPESVFDGLMFLLETKSLLPLWYLYIFPQLIFCAFASLVHQPSILKKLQPKKNCILHQLSFSSKDNYSKWLPSPDPELHNYLFIKSDSRSYISYIWTIALRNC